MVDSNVSASVGTEYLVLRFFAEGPFGAYVVMSQPDCRQALAAYMRSRLDLSEIVSSGPTTTSRFSTQLGTSSSKFAPSRLVTSSPRRNGHKAWRRC